MTMSFGMPDQAADAFRMSLRAARIIRLVMVLLLAFLLTVLVLISGQLNTITAVILAMIWALAIMIVMNGLRRKV